MRARLVEVGGRTIQTPAWATDPLRGRQAHAWADGWQPDPVAEWVELAALALHRFDPWMGVCLRVEYCTRSTQREKAERAGIILSRALKLRRYRQELDLARVWISGRLNAALAA